MRSRCCTHFSLVSWTRPESRSDVRHIECFRGQEVFVRTSKVIPLEVDGESCSPGVSGYDAHVIPGAVNVIVDSMSRYHEKSLGRAPRFPVDDIPYPQF